MLVSNNYYLNSPYLKIKNNLPNDSSTLYCLNKSDTSFCGVNKSSLKFALKYWGLFNLICGAIWAVNITDTLNSNQNQIETHSGWDNNVRVLASTGQKNSGYFNGYFEQLPEALSKSGVRTIEAASDVLAKTGYKSNIPYNWLSGFVPVNLAARKYLRHQTSFPLETPGSQLAIFDYTQKDKERFVLAFYDDSESGFSDIVDKFSEKIRQKYGISSENIMKFKLDSIDDIKHGLDTFLNKIKEIKNLENVELMVLYNGHGESESRVKGSDKIEGAMEGIIETQSKITESQIKELFHQKLQRIKTLLLLDTCHAGAWIADNASTALRIRG